MPPNMQEVENEHPLMFLHEKKYNPKLKPLRRAGIRKPTMFWPELLILKLYVKKVYWADKLTVEYD